MKKCSCGFESKSENLLFCINCGEIIGGDEYQNKHELNEASKKLKSFLGNLKNAKKDIVAPLTEVQDEFNRVQEILNFLKLSLKDEKNEVYESFIKECESFLERDASFQIAFVGTIKAGKSTLINAMLKKDYASMNETPETAALSKFKYGTEDKLKVKFYTKKEWNELWQSVSKSGGLFLDEYNKNDAASQKDKWVGHEDIDMALSKDELAKYTSAKSPLHYFVKEVEISLKDFPYQKNIVFVDTPGLNDAVAYRSNVTKDYINSANVVFACVKADKMENNDIIIINSIFDNTGGKPEKVYVLGTQYDQANHIEENWCKQKEEWSKYLSSKESNEQTRYTQKLAEKNIIPVSSATALWCALYRKNELGEKEIKALRTICFKLFGDGDIDANLDRLESFSNISNVFERIDSDIMQSAQSEIARDIKNRYSNLSRELKDYFKANRDNLEQNYVSSKQGLDAINARIKEQEDNLQDIQKTQDEMTRLMDEFGKAADEMLHKLNGELDKIIGEAR